MLKKRPDGRIVKSVPPIQKIMPYIMKTRTDSMNMYDDVFDCAAMDDYIKEQEARGIKMTYMHIFIAGVVRMIALRPQLNRFVMNGRIYARHKIYVSFVVHPRLCDGDVETTGLYYALSLRQLRRFIKNPKILETPLEAKVEDVP